MRQANVTRKTKETNISVTLNLDGGDIRIDIPSGFLGHMLDALSKHAGLGLEIKAAGDVHVDLHHTVEDIGIVLGQALQKALGDKRGITRYGLAKVPMDESLVEVCLDISGRPYFQIHGTAEFRGQAGDLDLELVPEFFRALAFNAGITLHMSVFASGNGHHLAEACFKAFARAIKEAVTVSGTEIPSTKASL
ncbi:MAG TPA: imidazoleglycerol-phosphate dehydratase HisB [Deltaproteobacteria bacterium]|nr:imidazoleglycerol-phosphate dehydratase HisB [Deltaproteobacteria bacterium]HPJ94021.1 imidazoleglycerol-phosphate dehydratase HisB [Deltaproteobacteria bacterium]HPR52748.1 imidazoleglycerol-phosphate dehydratase HisB [Deltaproteobacteria bacterium]